MLLNLLIKNDLTSLVVYMDWIFIHRWRSTDMQSFCSEKSNWMCFCIAWIVIILYESTQVRTEVDLPRNNEPSFAIIGPSPLKKMLITNACGPRCESLFHAGADDVWEIPRKFQAIIIWATPNDSKKHFNITILYVRDQEQRNLISYLQTCCDKSPTVPGTGEYWSKTLFWRW